MPLIPPKPFSIPRKPLLNDEQEPKDDQDEQDDEPEDQDEQEAHAQALGMLRATEDLTVLDFFAGMISTMANTMMNKGIKDADRDVVAERIYKMAQAMLRARAKIEDEELE